MQPKTRSLLQVDVAVLMLAGTAMFAKGIGLPVVKIICLRSLIGAVALLGFLMVRRTEIRVGRPGHWGIMVVLGMLICGHWITYFHALKVSTAAVAILALHTYPVFTALVEPFVFGERLRRINIVAAAGVLAGVMIMTPQLSLSNSTTTGVLFGVISALFWTARNLLSRKYVQQYSSATIMFWQMIVCGTILLPWLFAGEDVWTAGDMALLALLGAVFTAVPQVLLVAGLKNLSARTVGIATAMLVLYGPLMGWLIHNETVTVRMTAGGAVILACVLWETIRTTGNRHSARDRGEQRRAAVDDRPGPCCGG